MGFDENSGAGLRVRSVVVLILLRTVGIESLTNNETR
jgi:hypothetical protein